jgi:hypothetical protein
MHEVNMTTMGKFDVIWKRDARKSGCNWLRRVSFVAPNIVGSQNGTCFASPFRRLEFSDGFQTCGNLWISDLWESCCSMPQSPLVQNTLHYISLRRIAVEFMDRDSSVGIATRYGLDGPGIQSR